jgi:hypothetical protein
MRDLTSNIAVVTAIAPAVLTATNTPPGFDLLGFNTVAVVISTGAIAGAGNFTPKLQESDDNATFTDVAAADLIGTLPATLAAASTYKAGYKGFKRYIRPVLTLNSGTSIAAGVLLVKGDASQRPVA